MNRVLRMLALLALLVSPGVLLFSQELPTIDQKQIKRDAKERGKEAQRIQKQTLKEQGVQRKEALKQEKEARKQVLKDRTKEQKDAEQQAREQKKQEQAQLKEARKQKSGLHDPEVPKVKKNRKKHNENADPLNPS